MIKKLLFILFLSANLGFSQGTDVLGAEQFCSGTSKLIFNNVTGMPDNTQVGCLGSIPNAAYFYLEIDQPGDLIFTIQQEDAGGFPIDVDFIVWGPFTDLIDADNTISFTDCPTCPNNTANPGYYPYLDTAPNPDSPIVDCSYDTAAVERMRITNALQGEVYVVLITNYNGSQGIIDLQQTGGNGTTTCASRPVCGSNFYDSGNTAGPYSSNESNLDVINPYFSGGTVTVDFTMVDIPDTGDVLTVYNGPDASYPVLGTVTGLPATFTSTTVGNPTGAISFGFISDGDSNVGLGWAADITCTPPPTPPTCGQTFYDSGGPTGNYSNYEFETTTFYPDTAGDALTATFTLFDLEFADDLYVYDGPNTSSPLLGVFNGTTIPGPFTSSHPSGALTFVFDSDYSVTYDGWAADLTCAPYVPPTVCNSTFTDSGGAGGNYSNYESTTTTLTPDVPNTFLEANFTTFGTENNYDYLYIYDGPDATFPIIGTYTGTNSPGTVTSTHSSGSLTFVFTSDFSNTNIGWTADITCIDQCNLAITDTVYPLGADECNLDYTELTTNAPIPAPGATVYSESFDGATFPTGWNVFNGSTNAAWSISNSNNAGGTANEAHLEWLTGSQNSNWRITSPAIDITGQTNLQLSFKHELDVFGAGTGISIRVQTSLTGTGGWTNQYVVTNGGDIAATTQTIDLSALDGNTTLYIRFRLNGNSYNFNDWYVDDILLTADGPPLQPQVTWSPTANLYTDNTLTTPYVGGFAGTVYAAPNGTQVYTATDNNGCTDNVTVLYNKKTWNGSVDDNWYRGANWTPAGVPTINNCIVIPDNASVPNDPISNKFLTPPPTPPQPAQGRNLTLEDGAYLEVETNTELIIQEWIDVQGTGIFNLKSSASLIQIEDSAVNSGNIHVQRSPNFDESAVAGSEYIYWSSPVANFQVTNISPSSSLLFDWTPTVVGNGAGNHGQWYAASGAMTNGKGYIVRGLGGTPATIPATAYPVSNNTALFSGTPNNGVITRNIFHGNWNGGDYPGIGNTATDQDDNWNLIGNPYPSAISANAFTDINTNINGTIYVWPHDNTYSAINLDPFYENYVYNYDGNDYIEHNNTGSNPPGTNDLFIASGQAFFVLMNHGATSGTSVTFNNSMRQVLSTYDNNTFFRTENPQEDSSQVIVNKHRIWLDLLSPNNTTNTLLVGYVANASNDFDRQYDGYDFSSGDNSGFYSILNDESLSIQGRALPFSEEDTVPLGLIANETGSHTIAINTLDGLFLNEDQNIYIEDTELNSIHNIKMSPYTFTIDAGIHNDRFILRYTNQTLNVNTFDTNDILITAPKGDYIKVTTGIGTINTVAVYDIVGKVIFASKNINLSEFVYEESRLSAGAYIVKVELTNGKQKIQKVVLRQ
ncbi:CUB domain-containing protein [Psychroserpens sp. SPM9]|uniref:CUB domain-containing protein n=1 Tax=Psychroserpens sp. SPM9 TaxID=2975598 RepID=UPI0021A6E469|nr:CUB domain-containing protein [Psychroserpens sp. SPM9]MDG5489952.1 T9SS type A sorting domain-containing protein [Psychroserpens sp. SPM9]